MYIAIRKSNSEILEKNHVVPELSERAVLDSMVRRYGGVDADYSVCFITDSTAKERIFNGDEFVAAVDGSGTATGVSFAAEDAKRYINFALDKTSLTANGIDTATLTVTVRSSNDSQVEAFNGDIDIPILCGTMATWVTATFVNGVATLPIRAIKTFAGLWQFPDQSRFSPLYRIKNRAQLKVKLPNLNLV